MPYRKHICKHATWNHLCAGEHIRDHNAFVTHCPERWHDDPTSVTLFDLADGEMAF